MTRLLDYLQRRLPRRAFIPLMIAILVLIFFVCMLTLTVIIATALFLLVSAAHAILAWIGVPT